MLHHWDGKIVCRPMSFLQVLSACITISLSVSPSEDTVLSAFPARSFLMRCTTVCWRDGINLLNSTRWSRCDYSVKQYQMMSFLMLCRVMWCGLYHGWDDTNLNLIRLYALTLSSDTVREYLIILGNIRCHCECIHASMCTYGKESLSVCRIRQDITTNGMPYVFGLWSQGL